jgi:hypothetical protein
MQKHYTCVTGKDDRIYVFRINKNGKKHRVKNIYADKCPKDELPDCNKPCKNGKISKKANPPCTKKGGVFVDKQDITQYCKTKTPGLYKRREREKVAKKANILLKKIKRDMNKSALPEKSIRRIQFAPPTDEVYEY